MMHCSVLPKQAFINLMTPHIEQMDKLNLVTNTSYILLVKCGEAGYYIESTEICQLSAHQTIKSICTKFGKALDISVKFSKSFEGWRCLPPPSLPLALLYILRCCILRHSFTSWTSTSYLLLQLSPPSSLSPPPLLLLCLSQPAEPVLGGPG